MENKTAGQILVVDDQENWRAALSILLTEAGHSVQTVATFEEAQATLKQTRFDIVILDVRLVDADVFNVQGLELLTLAKDRPQAPKVVILTGYPESIFTGVLKRLEANALILKVPPGAKFDSQVFKNQIQSLLADG